MNIIIAYRVIFELISIVVSCHISKMFDFAYIQYELIQAEEARCKKNGIDEEKRDKEIYRAGKPEWCVAPTDKTCFRLHSDIVKTVQYYLLSSASVLVADLSSISDTKIKPKS